MKKREELKKEKKNFGKSEKLVKIKNVLTEKGQKLKNKKVIAISLILIALVVAIVVVLLNRKSTSISGMTITQELMRALQYEQFE